MDIITALKNEIKTYKQILHDEQIATKNSTDSLEEYHHQQGWCDGAEFGLMRLQDILHRLEVA